MSNKYVYLAGPIAGCDYTEAITWRSEVAQQFASGIIGISPMRGKDWFRGANRDTSVHDYATLTVDDEYLITAESHAIHARDLYDVKNADFVFMYLLKEHNDRRPSWGTAIELGWASAFGIPIVLVTDDESLASHPLVRESVGWIVPTLKTGVAVVNSVLKAYTQPPLLAHGRMSPGLFKEHAHG